MRRVNKMPMNSLYDLSHAFAMITLVDLPYASTWKVAEHHEVEANVPPSTQPVSPGALPDETEDTMGPREGIVQNRDLA